MAVALLFRLFGFLLVGLAVAQAIPLVVALAVRDAAGTVGFGMGAGLAVFFGVVMIIAGTGGSRRFGRREAVVLAVGAWVILSWFAAIPIAVAQVDTGIAGAIVEAASGLTTTGLTVFEDPGALGPSLVVWRALLQWLGGFATVLFAASLVPHIGLVSPSGWSAADTPGFAEAFRPRLRQLVPGVAATYGGLTSLCLFGLLASGLPFLDAACYAMSVISTGGFAPNGGGPLAYGNDWVLLVLCIGMMLGAISFTLHWAGATGRPAAYLRDPETGFLLVLVTAGAAILFVVLAAIQGESPGDGVRHAVLQTVAAATTTGFAYTGPVQEPVFVIFMLAGFAMIGGATASTAGGLKLMRALLLLRQSLRELERLVHPHGVMLIKLGRASVTDATMQSIWAFFVLFVFSLIVLAAALSAAGLDFGHALVLALSAMTNCGPVLTQAAGYGADLGNLSLTGKYFVAVGMLVGRLEIFALLILLTPIFWKR